MKSQKENVQDFENRVKAIGKRMADVLRVAEMPHTTWWHIKTGKVNPRMDTMHRLHEAITVLEKQHQEAQSLPTKG